MFGRAEPLGLRRRGSDELSCAHSRPAAGPSDSALGPFAGAWAMGVRVEFWIWRQHLGCGVRRIGGVFWLVGLHAVLEGRPSCGRL